MKTTTLPPRPSTVKIALQGELPEFVRRYDMGQDEEYFTIGDVGAGQAYIFEASRLHLTAPLSLKIEVPWSDVQGRKLINASGFTWSRARQAFTPSLDYQLCRDPERELRMLEFSLGVCQLLGLRIYPNSRAVLCQRWEQLSREGLR